LFAHPGIPIVIAEGAKKTYAAMSAGFPAVGLTGIWNGVRADRDENGKTTGYELIPSVKHLSDRQILIAFDRDSNCPFAHFHIPDLIKQNLCFAMVSAFKENSRLFISFIFLSTDELYNRDRIFGKT
jgi:hypothetical protein